MFNLEEDNDCFKKDYLETNNHCNLNRMQDLFTETDNKVKNLNGYNFKKLLDNYDKKVKVLINNCKNYCYKCHCKFVDTNMSNLK